MNLYKVTLKGRFIMIAPMSVIVQIYGSRSSGWKVTVEKWEGTV